MWADGYDPRTLVVADPEWEKQEADRRREADRRDAELARRRAAAAPPAGPAGAARPALAATFRASVVGRGQVLVMTNAGAADVAVVAVRVAGRFEAAVGTVPAGQGREVGWLELGVELRAGDLVEVWVGGRLDQTVTVP